MTDEQTEIVSLFNKLVSEPLHSFPSSGRMPKEVSSDQGVYVIYGKEVEVLHVGKSSRGKKGIFQRLTNHLDGLSSFVILYFERDKARVRACNFRYLPIENARKRALLEAYATGCLCPAHIGLNEKTSSK